MPNSKNLVFSLDVILCPLAFVLLLWIVFWAETRFGWNFTYLGIYPLKIEGLRGIIFGPLVHSSLKHLFNNSIPLFVLSTALFYFYKNIRWKVLFFGVFLTGLLTWSIGRSAFHIGASGVVYLLAAFLFFKGIFSKRYQLTALSFVVVFLYGSLLWYLFPIDPKISWEGHLSGFIIGFVLAIFFRKNPVENKIYDWQRDDYNPEEDEFLKHFDEEGNFVETPPEVEEVDTAQHPIKIKYTFKKKSIDRNIE